MEDQVIPEYDANYTLLRRFVFGPVPQAVISMMITDGIKVKRNQLVFIFALVSLTYLLPISGQMQLATAAESLLPRISFEKTVFDLGDVGRGTKNSCEFRFTNTGRGLLKIGNISRTCGCTVFHLDKKQYPPNEPGLIKVIY